MPVIKQNRISEVGEFGLIGMIQETIGDSSKVIENIGDDTAVLPYSRDKYLLFTTDMLVEGIHFTKTMDIKAVGRKAIACNISDVAAMGGLPKFAIVSLGVPKQAAVKTVQSLYKGMKALAKKYDVVICGGDTVKSDKMIINVALIGEVKKNRLLRRKGARSGDQIFVTGALGNSLKSGHHLRFIPRIKEAQYLVKHAKPSAMIDISDGLSSDLGHILKSSGVGAVLDQNAIPKRAGAALNNVLNNGEDFELLFTVNKAKAAKLKSLKHLKFYHIGEITSRKGGLQMLNGKMKKIAVGGYRHF